MKRLLRSDLTPRLNFRGCSPPCAASHMSASEQPLLDQLAEDGPLAEAQAAAAMLRLATALIDRVATNGGSSSLVPLLNTFPDNVLMRDDGAIKLSNGARNPRITVPLAACVALRSRRINPRQLTCGRLVLSFRSR